MINTWNKKVEKAKYKRRNTNDNKRGYEGQNTKCKVQYAKCKMRNVKYKIEVAIATANMNVMPFYIRLSLFLYLFSPPLQLPSFFLSLVSLRSNRQYINGNFT